MYARIVDNKIVELDAGDFGGVAGWKEVPAHAVDGPRLYDAGTGLVRLKTDAEITAEYDASVVADAWGFLRSQRNGFLRETDEYAVNDRAATANMPEYREYLRDLPATYNDTSILTQTAVMDFDAYVASL